MSWNAYAFDSYLLSAPTPPQKPILEHNFGITHTNDGMGLCHTFWEGQDLAVIDLWTDPSRSINLLVSQVTKITNSWNAAYHHSFDIFCGNQAVQNAIVTKLYEQKMAHPFECIECAVRPRDASSYLQGFLEDGQIAVTKEMRSVFSEALLRIGEDEFGKATGDPQSLCLLYGLGEPFNHRFRPDEMEVRGRAQAERIKALLG